LRDSVCEIINTKPWITPIIVFTNAFVAPLKPIKGVIVVNKKYLNNTIQRPNRPIKANNNIWEQKEKIGNSLIQ
jgi:hypothetical protein